jgi:hypothetical protein
VNKKLLSGILLAVLGVASCLLAQQDAQSGDAAVKVAGTWQMSWQGRKGAREATLQIQQAGSKLSGTFEAQGGSAPLSGSVQGDKISLTAAGEKKERTFIGTVEGNKMSGTMKRGGSWTATRQ